MSNYFTIPMQFESVSYIMNQLAKVNVSLSLSMAHTTYLSTEKTRAILPIARILFLITSFRALAAPPIKKGGENEMGDIDQNMATAAASF